MLQYAANIGGVIVSIFSAIANFIGNSLLGMISSIASIKRTYLLFVILGLSFVNISNGISALLRTSSTGIPYVLIT